MSMLSVCAAAWAMSAGFAGPMETIEDGTITARVETLYTFNKHLTPFNINTSTNDGIVTLTGGVREQFQKDLAEDLARSVSGVHEVDNEIIVTPTTPPPPRRGWRRAIKDSSISTAVRSRLVFHKQFRGLRLGVHTRRGVVRLSGVVPTAEDKEIVETVALHTKGVRDVINELTVRRKGSISSPHDALVHISDEWLEKRVETSIVLNRRIGIRNMDVEMNDGVCILTGIADSEEQRRLAGQIAENIRGIDVVQNDLMVRHVRMADDKSTPVTLEPLEPATSIEPIDPSYELPTYEEDNYEPPQYDESWSMDDPLVKPYTPGGTPEVTNTTLDP